jgi:DNA-binding transcriptional MerR regulator
VVVNGKLTTAEAAKEADISMATLNRWIVTGSIQAPKATLIGAVGYRLWSRVDVEKLKKYKQENYRKGRGRKPKSKR